ncbi:hypothetical protein NDU88_002081 [Pleurodeles waltl]|uniref:Uncharacterized protein n=1 Tax=Pleurodeles waltl TaxID=8319 RepID=A0AAV7T0X9_PLEWA|nr:hypothetical protein NDU88_002081 [Pleurodeles waltl]
MFAPNGPAVNRALTLMPAPNGASTNVTVQQVQQQPVTTHMLLTPGIRRSSGVGLEGSALAQKGATLSSSHGAVGNGNAKNRPCPLEIAPEGKKT